MKINGFGKDISDNFVDGHMSRLREYLSYVQQMGFDVAELGVSGLNVIINGRLFPEQVERVKAVLADYPLRYTVHAPNRTNLAFRRDTALEKAVLTACVEFCGAIEARTLVYHSGLQALDAARTGLTSLPDTDALQRGAAREVYALKALASLAADLGVTIAMENGDPHLWEYGVLKRNEQPPENLPDYHGRLRITNILMQLEAIDHSAIGLCLDLAHLHLATHALGDNYLAAVQEAAPWVRHLHCNDNFGKLDIGFDSEMDRLPYGEADLHLPPAWGAIPFAEAFTRLDHYEGDLILEIKERYWDNFPEALANIRQILAGK
jgi:sugar phosphate isomerase/epimerase